VNAELLIDAHRLSRPTLGSLVRTGLAAARREVVVAGDRPVEVLRLRITAAARWSMAGSCSARLRCSARRRNEL
jgi:hypothetical protein